MVNPFDFQPTLYPDVGHHHLICSFRSLVLVLKHQRAVGASLEGFVAVDCLTGVEVFQGLGFPQVRLPLGTFTLCLCAQALFVHFLPCAEQHADWHTDVQLSVFPSSTAGPQAAACSLQPSGNSRETKDSTALDGKDSKYETIWNIL